MASADHRGSTEWRVLKFGGTSVSSLANWRNIAGVVRRCLAAGESPLVVHSALSGITDALERLLAAALAGESAAILAEIRGRHEALAGELGVAVPAGLETHLADLAKIASGITLVGEVSDHVRARVMAAGELMATELGAAYLGAAGLNASLVDVRGLLTAVTRRDATDRASVLSASCDYAPNPQLAASLAARGSVIITQGFIGATADHRTTTLGRGGSDYTAAILGWACDASLIEIWTDVSGIYSCDPRVIPTAAPIAILGFQHVRELALYGAKVIHPETILPAVSASIPVRILNTFAPNEAGTTIVASPDHTDARIVAVSILRDCRHVLASRAILALMRTASGLDGAIVVGADALDSGALVVRCTTIEHVQAFDALCESSNLDATPCGVLAVCSTGEWTSEQIANVMQCLEGCSVLAVTSGATHTSLLVVLEDTDVVHGSQRIHDAIIHRR
jgi:aspartate kinase